MHLALPQRLVGRPSTTTMTIMPVTITRTMTTIMPVMTMKATTMLKQATIMPTMIMTIPKRWPKPLTCSKAWWRR